MQLIISMMDPLSCYNPYLIRANRWLIHRFVSRAHELLL